MLKILQRYTIRYIMMTTNNKTFITDAKNIICGFFLEKHTTYPSKIEYFGSGTSDDCSDIRVIVFKTYNYSYMFQFLKSEANFVQHILFTVKKDADMVASSTILYNDRDVRRTFKKIDQFEKVSA